MSIAVRSLLDTFDKLGSEDRLRVAAEILLRLRVQETTPLEEPDLLLIADEIFLELDAREATDAGE